MGEGKTSPASKEYGMADDLQAVRPIFIRASKHYELTDDGTPTGDDNGADAWINAGQKWLDREVSHPFQMRRTQRALAVGDFQVEIEKLISIESIAIVADTVDTGHADITDNYLQPGEFRRKFASPIDQWDSGKPGYWTLNVAGLDPEHRAKEDADYVSDGIIDEDDTIYGDGTNANYTDQGILFHPVCDAVYTLKILGRFYSPTLAVNADKSFWTVHEPHILAYAAAMMLEMSMRNQAGVRSWQEALLPLLNSLDNHAVEHELSGFGPFIMEG